MAQIRTLKLNLLADVAKFGAGMKAAGGDVRKLDTATQRSAKRIKAAFAGMGAAAAYAAIRIGKDAVQAAAEDQKSQLTLAGQLKATTNATNDQIKSVEKWITKTQFATGVADNDLRKGLERLVRSTKDVTEAQKLSTLALDISKRTGKDYQTVVMALAKANDGQFNALKRLGITLGDNANNAKDLIKANNDLTKAQQNAQSALEEFGAGSTEYVKALSKVEDKQRVVNELNAAGVDWVGELGKEFGGAAAAYAETYAGKLEILNQRMQELQETAGAKLLPVLSNLADIAIDAAKGFAGESASLADSMSRVTKEGYYQKTGGENLGSALKHVSDEMARLFDLLKTDGDKSSGILNTLTKALNLYGDALGYIADNAERTKKYAGWLSKGGVLGTITRTVVEKMGGRATGGSVSAGQAYTVGEFGRETFIPNSSGRIVPNGGGGNTVININGIVDAESARRSIEKLLQNSARRTGAINLTGATL